MKIACDLDDCLVATCIEVLALVNKRTDNCFLMEDLTEFGIENRFDVGISEVVDAVMEVLSRDSVPCFPDAIDALNMLYKENTWEDFFILTHRREDKLKNTKVLVNSLGLDFNFELALVSHNKSGVPAKAEYVQQHNIDVLIEDRFDTSIDVAGKTEASVILINKPWNSKEKVPVELYDKIVRLDDWKQIAEYLRMIKILDGILEETNAKT